nr:hypothetical protein B0A51_16632 [Rachicladosporium sp. CCFEE 5018]
MRLFNTGTYEVGEPEYAIIQRYAILSHRWHAKEISYQHLESAEKIAESINLPHFAKIRSACAKAASLGYQWLWIDTCCINKQDNAELTESLNSMYKWYRQASECLIYLSDVDHTVAKGPTPFAVAAADESEVRESQWFTRGWTLQELLACKTARFYDVNWDEIGTKDTLAPDLQRITHIEAGYLDHRKSLQLASIATKLSWVCDRITTRPEDRVYSLVGLFDVYLPIQYGEGLKKAFRRLQLELLTTPDESLFAWTLPGPSWEPPPGYDSDEYGLLAPSIECFGKSGGVTHVNKEDYRPRSAAGYSMVQTGVMFPVPTIEFEKKVWNWYTISGLFVPPATIPLLAYAERRRNKFGFPLTLNCWNVNNGRVGAPVRIWIRKGDESSHFAVWRRFRCDEWILGTQAAKWRRSGPVTELAVAQP